MYKSQNMRHYRVSKKSEVEIKNRLKEANDYSGYEEHTNKNIFIDAKTNEISEKSAFSHKIIKSYNQHLNYMKKTCDVSNDHHIYILNLLSVFTASLDIILTIIACIIYVIGTYNKNHLIGLESADLTIATLFLLD